MSSSSGARPGSAWSRVRRYSAGSTNSPSSVVVTRPPRITIAIGCTISSPGALPAMTNGIITSAIAAVLVTIGPSRSSAPRSTRPGPKASPSRSSSWIATDQHDAVPRREGEQREEPDQRPEGHLGSVDQRREHSADQCHGSAGTRAPPAASRRNRPAAAGTSRSGRRPKAMIWPVPISLAGRLLSAPSRGTRAGRSTPCRRSSMSFATESRLRPLTSASTSRRRDTSSRWIESGVCTTRTSATWPRRTWPPPGRSSSRLRTSATLSRVLGLALHDHVEDLLALEDAADRDALQQGSLRTAHVARLDLVALRLVEVDLDLDLRLRGRLRHAGSTTPSTCETSCRTRSACRPRTSCSCPKTRTTSGLSVPVSTSRPLPRFGLSPSSSAPMSWIFWDQ